MINIVVPMAGRGSRFTETGEIDPKPLIEVQRGKRMIEYVIDYLTLPEPHRFIFICLKRGRATISRCMAKMSSATSTKQAARSAFGPSSCGARCWVACGKADS